jgi:hypothetical protein
MIPKSGIPVFGKIMPKRKRGMIPKVVFRFSDQIMPQQTSEDANDQAP